MHNWSGHAGEANHILELEHHGTHPCIKQTHTHQLVEQTTSLRLPSLVPTRWHIGDGQIGMVLKWRQMWIGIGVLASLPPLWPGTVTAN